MKKQLLIKNPSVQSLILLLLSMSGYCLGGEPYDLFSCVDANKRWDYKTQSCIQTKKWQVLPDSLRPVLDRPLSINELNQAKKEMGLFSEHTISQQEAPHAIILIGTAGSGKSSLVPFLGKWLEGYHKKNYVHFDGDILRNHHKGYNDISSIETIVYKDAWLVAKPHFASMKMSILDEITEQQRNIIIPTGVHGPRYFNILKRSGYHITVIGVYVDYETALYRGKNRAEWTGRTYTGGFDHWQTGLKHMLSLSKEPSDTPTIFIDNTDFDSPQVIRPEEIESQVEQ